jgi:hypothetical protein
MKNEIVPGRYQHYKGNIYIVLASATHSETLEKMIVYYPEKDGKGKLWVRPEPMFHDQVPGPDGKMTPRFSFLQPQDNHSE